MGKTLGDDIEDHFYGRHGVVTNGSSANQLGLLEYQRKQRGAQVEAVGTPATGASPSPVAPSVPFEDGFANLFSVAVFGAATYFGALHVPLELYWTAAGALLLAVLVKKLLRGPLRILLTTIKYLLLIAFWSVLMGGAWYLFATA